LALDGELVALMGGRCAPAGDTVADTELAVTLGDRGCRDAHR
jgi:hypothetical protein